MPGGSLSFGVGATNHAHFRAVTGDTAEPSELKGQGAFTPPNYLILFKSVGADYANSINIYPLRIFRPSYGLATAA